MNITYAQKYHASILMLELISILLKSVSLKHGVDQTQ